jgi:hypothetical protein
VPAHRLCQRHPAGALHAHAPHHFESGHRCRRSVTLAAHVTSLPCTRVHADASMRGCMRQLTPCKSLQAIMQQKPRRKTVLTVPCSHANGSIENVIGITLAVQRTVMWRPCVPHVDRNLVCWRPQLAHQRAHMLVHLFNTCLGPRDGGIVLRGSSLLSP